MTLPNSKAKSSIQKVAKAGTIRYAGQDVKMPCKDGVRFGLDWFKKNRMKIRNSMLPLLIILEELMEEIKGIESCS